MTSSEQDRAVLSEVEYQVAEYDVHLDDAVQNVADERGIDYFAVHDAVSRAKIERAHNT